MLLRLVYTISLPERHRNNIVTYDLFNEYRRQEQHLNNFAYDLFILYRRPVQHLAKPVSTTPGIGTVYPTV